MHLPSGSYAKDIDVVGYTDVRGRPAFKMAIREVAGRWHLYTGHFWEPGWSIIDVTDPTSPNVVAFIKGPENTGTLQVVISGTTMVTALEKILPGFGGKPDAPFEVWRTKGRIRAGK